MFKAIALQFNAGGPFMWVILVVLAIAVAVFLERAIFYFILCRNDGNKLVAGIAKALNANDVETAKKIAGAKRAPLNMLLLCAVERHAAGMSIDDIQEGLEETSVTELPRLTERINYLSLFANAATLLGLLGTIVGLQLLFASLATVDASQKAALLARGIAEAMNATGFGLITAIPCMFAYTFLFNTQARITKNLDAAVVKMMNYLKKKMA